MRMFSLIQELKKIIAFDDEVLIVIRNGEPSVTQNKRGKAYYDTAVLAKIKQLLKNPDSNNYRATITGIKRSMIKSLSFSQFVHRGTSKSPQAMEYHAYAFH